MVLRIGRGNKELLNATASLPQPADERELLFGPNLFVRRVGDHQKPRGPLVGDGLNGLRWIDKMQHPFSWRLRVPQGQLSGSGNRAANVAAQSQKARHLSRATRLSDEMKTGKAVAPLDGVERYVDGLQLEDPPADEVIPG